MERPEADDPKTLRQLNLGCGRDKRPDCLNVDFNPAVEPDLVWNLDRRPFPLARSGFDTIYVKDVVEHVEDLMGFMEEVHELLAPGGTVVITTPHFSCANAFTDPTHRRQLGYFSFDYFTDGSAWSFYSSFRFDIARRLLVFHNGVLDRVVARIANRHPAYYERRLAWLFPAWFLIFELVARKDGAPGAAAG